MHPVKPPKYTDQHLRGQYVPAVATDIRATFERARQEKERSKVVIVLDDRRGAR